MKKIISLSFAIIIAAFLAFGVPNYAFASNTNNFPNFPNFFHFNTNHFPFPNFPNFFHFNTNHKEDEFCKKHPQDNKCKKDNDNKDCKKHPEKRECHKSVPEFGFIPGAIALLSSGGTFLYLKKRKLKI